MRALRRLKAFLMRTFVGECPACHKHFYGHHAYKEQHKIAGKHYRIVCHRH